MGTIFGLATVQIPKKASKVMQHLGQLETVTEVSTSTFKFFLLLTSIVVKDVRIVIKVLGLTFINCGSSNL